MESSPNKFQTGFREGIVMPPVPPAIEPTPEPEHPNAPLLEHILANQDAKAAETNTLLEHLLTNSEVKTAESNTLLEHNLLVSSQVVEELKNLQTIIKDDNEPWDIKLILE